MRNWSVRAPRRRALVTWLIAALTMGAFVPAAHATTLTNPTFTFSEGSTATAFKLTFTPDVNAASYTAKIYDVDGSSPATPIKIVTNYISGSDITGDLCNYTGQGGNGNFCGMIALGHKFTATITTVPSVGFDGPSESSQSNRIGILYAGSPAIGISQYDSSQSGLYFGKPPMNGSVASMDLNFYRTNQGLPQSGDTSGRCSDSNVSDLNTLYSTVTGVNASGSLTHINLPAQYCYRWTTKYIASLSPDGNGVTWYDSAISSKYPTAKYVQREMSPPRNLSVIAGNKTLTVSWDAPLAGSSPVSNYYLELSNDGGYWFYPESYRLSPTQTSIVISKYLSGSNLQFLENGTPYYVRVMAVGTDPDSKPSVYLSSQVSYTPATTPDEPSISTTSTGDQTITLNWSAPTNTGGAEITGYVGQTSLDGSSWTTAFDVDSATTTEVISNLVNGTPYYIRIATKNRVGTGNYLLLGTPITPYGQPTIQLTVTGVGQETATATVTGDAKGTHLTPTIRIGEFGGSPTSHSFAETTGAYSYTWNITGLNRGAHYNVTARAETHKLTGGVASDFGTSDASAVDISTTPNAPQNVSLVRDAKSITASWDTFNEPIGANISYDVEAQHNGSQSGTGCTEVTASQNSRSTCQITGLSGNTSYDISITASISGAAVGNGTSSPTVVSTSTKTAQSIAFSLSGVTKSYGDSPFQISATASSSLAVSFASNSQAICSLAGATISIVNSGTCSITASQEGDATYSAATPVTETFTVSKRSQVISFNTPVPTSKTYGDSQFTVSPSVNSSQAVVATSATPSVCTIISRTVTLVSGGTCELKFNADGNSTYSAAPEVTKTIVIAKASQSIDFPALPTGKRVGDIAFSIPSPASATSTLPIQYSSIDTSKCTISGSVISILEVGTCSIAADQLGSNRYEAALQVIQTFTISKATQSIYFPTIADRSSATGSIAVTANASSNLSVTLTSSTTSVCTVSGNIVTLKTPGTCTISATQAGDSQYEPAITLTNSFEINGKLDAVLSNFPDQSMTYGVGSFHISAPTASVPGTFTYESNNYFLLPVSGETATVGYVGTATITAIFTPNDTNSYNGSSISKTVTIAAGTQADVTITSTKSFDAYVLSSSGGSGFGFTSYSLTNDSSSDCNVTFWGYATRVGEGDCRVIATKSTDGMYAEKSSNPLTLTFAKTAQSITFSLDYIGTLTYGAWPMYISASSSSGLAVTLTSRTPSVCSMIAGELTIKTGGTCRIAANQSGNSYYAEAQEVVREITINKVSLTVTPATMYLPVGDDFDSRTVSISYSGFISFPFPESASDLDGSLSCTTNYSNSSIAGDYTIICSGYTSDKYDIHYNQATLTAYTSYLDPGVSLWSQSLTFNRLDTPQKYLTDGSLNITAYASTTSGLRIRFQASPLSICEVNKFGLLTLKAVGNCTVTADVPEGSGYAAASAQMQTFSILASAPADSGGGGFIPPPPAPVVTPAPTPAVEETPAPEVVATQTTTPVPTPTPTPVVEPTPSPSPTPVTNPATTPMTKPTKAQVVAAQKSIITQQKLVAKIRKDYTAALNKARVSYNQAIAAAKKFIRTPSKYNALKKTALTAYNNAKAKALKVRDAALKKALAVIANATAIVNYKP